MSDELQRLRDQNARLKEKLIAAQKALEETSGMISAEKADSLKRANQRLSERLVSAQSECRYLRGRK